MLFLLQIDWFIIYSDHGFPSPSLPRSSQHHHIQKSIAIFLSYYKRGRNLKIKTIIGKTNRKSLRKSTRNTNIETHIHPHTKAEKHKNHKPQCISKGFICLKKFTPGHGSAYKCGLCICDTLWEEENSFFLCGQLSVGAGFWVRDGGLCSLLLSELEPHLA